VNFFYNLHFGLLNIDFSRILAFFLHVQVNY